MNLFLQINLILGVAGVLFASFEKVLSYFEVRMSYVRILRFAQALFVASIALPIALRAVPQKSMSGVQSSTFQVYSEGMEAKPWVAPSSKDRTAKTSSLLVSSASDYQPNLGGLILGLWMLGCLFFIFRFAKNYWKVRNILLGAVVIRQQGRVKLVASEDVFVPFSVFLGRKMWIVLPQTLLSMRVDRDLAIKHELQHHRQGDTWWTMGMELVSCFFFFNPAIYLWKNIITEYQEFSCDESLTGQKKISSHDYGSCLLRVAEAALEHREMYVGTTSMAAIIKDSQYFKKFLMRRIEMITEEKSYRRNWLALLAGITMLGVSLTAAIAAEKFVRGSINSGTVEVDQDVQKIADDVLTRSLKRMKATAGFIIVAEPSTGRILAVSNMDLKKKRQGRWILNNLMETASIAKPIVVAEAFETGKTDLTSKHNCENGKYNYNGTVYRDWKSEGWSELTTTEAIEVSSNVCAIKIAEQVGEAGLDSMLDKFGFGAGGTAQRFPQARAGERPVKGGQFIPQVTSGFGFKSSALEIVQAYGALVNGGVLMEPVSHNGQAKVLRRVISVENSGKMRTLLQNAVLRGTGKKAESDLYTSGGKTASSLLNDFMNIEWYGTKKSANYAGFIGFAPVNNPAIEVYVGILNPNTDGSGAHGGGHAAPVFKEVIENVLTHLKVAPDKL